MKPIKENVLIKLDPLENVTSSGIILINPDKPVAQFGEVVKIGSLVTDVSPGDRVAVCKHYGNDVTINGLEHVLVKQENIEGVL